MNAVQVFNCLFKRQHLCPTNIFIVPYSNSLQLYDNIQVRLD